MSNKNKFTDSSSTISCTETGTCTASTYDTSNSTCSTCGGTYESDSSCSQCKPSCTDTSSTCTDTCTQCHSSTDSCSCSTDVSCLGTLTSACDETTCTDTSKDCDEKCDKACQRKNLLTSDADVFVYDGACIHQNADRGVGYDVPLVLGANRLDDVEGIHDILDCKTEDPLLAVNGPAYVAGNIYTHHNIYAVPYKGSEGPLGGKIVGDELQVNKATVKCLYVEEALIGNANVVLCALDKYIEALPSKCEDNNVKNATYYHLNPKDNIGVLYVNPVNGPIYIILGSEDDESCQDDEFKPNQLLTIKDVSQNFSEGSSYNVYVTVPTSYIPSNQIYIQHYDASCRLKTSGPGTYVLNTSGGSVTYRFMKPPLIGGHSTWLIENQLVGNPRVLPGTGLVFSVATTNDCSKLLGK